MTTVLRYAKAIAGFVTPGIVVLLTSITDSSDGGSSITGNEWSAIGLAMFLTGGAVAAVKNAPKEA